MLSWPLQVGLRHQVQDDFAVDRGLENRALGFEFIAQLGGVGQVAVVGDGDLAAARNRTVSGWALRMCDEPVVE